MTVAARPGVEAPAVRPPCVRLARLRVGARYLRIRLHLAGGNRFGSIKERTAEALLASLELRGSLRPGVQLVESTSGNLGIALAGLCAERGYRCTLVVDQNASEVSLRQILAFGAELIHLAPGGPRYGVTGRLHAVRDYLVANPRAVWTDQYHNPAGPAAHASTTGPALVHAPGLPPPQAVMVPVSTGGVLAGVAEYIRANAPEVAVWGIDAVGSAATGGRARSRPGKLPGFGSARRSGFLGRSRIDHIGRVSDAEAAAACRMVKLRTGLALGGSAGAAVLGAVRAARGDPSLTDVACLCPDGGDRYESVIYRPDLLLAEVGRVSPDVAAMGDLELDLPDPGGAVTAIGGRSAGA